MRRRLRALRLSLAADERRFAEKTIADALRRTRIFRRGRRVAVYLAMRGEVDLTGIIAAARRAGCELCVPRITSRRRGAMVFVPFHPESGLRRNVYGIAEPVAATRHRLKPLSIDVVLLPVVGFDRDGNRLGMGAGYYDRALKQRRDAARRWRRPRLIGIAYSCQEVERIRPSSWDVPLDLVVTEREIIQPARAADRPA